MDNSFYENRNKNEKNKENYTSVKILLVQICLSLLLSGILFFVCRGNTVVSKNIKKFYVYSTEKDITAAEMLETLKKVTVTTFAPSEKFPVNETENQ